MKPRPTLGPNALLALSLACGVFACASSDNDGPPGSDVGADGPALNLDMGPYDPSAPQTAEAFCNELVEVVCRGNVTCCESPSERYASVDACVAQNSYVCTGQFSGIAFRDGLVHFNASVAAELLEAARTAVDGCGPYPDLDRYPVFEGTLPEGSDCGPVGEDYSLALACAPPNDCIVHVSGTPDGPTTTTTTCEREAGLGEDCLDSFCQGGLYCDGEAICRAELADGADCDGDWVCEHDNCVDGRCAPPSAEDLQEDFCSDLL